MRIKRTTKPGQVLVELNPSEDTLLTGAARETQPTSAFRLQNILVPVDFSTCSDKALQYAVCFARQFGARLLLIHVIPVNYPAVAEPGMLDVPALEKDLRDGAEQELAALAQQSVPPSLQSQTLVRTGRAAHEIVQAARESQVDLIVIATHGHTGLKHVLLGSTAESVVRRAPCPVLTVREHEHEFLLP